MRLTLITFILFFLNQVSAQDFDIQSKQLNDKEIETIFPDSLLKALRIDSTIYRVYQFIDRNGRYYIIMSENELKTKKCDKIKAYCFESIEDELLLKWKLKDFILPEGNEVAEEFSISFWTKYFKLDDFDSDGTIDPIVVYGTFGYNRTSEGRIKILIYYKNQKIAIRHQNGTLDFERNTQVDAKFYTLPVELQNRVKEIMVNIKKDRNGIFPYGWQEAMRNKELKFDEN